VGRGEKKSDCFANHWLSNATKLHERTNESRPAPDKRGLKRKKGKAKKLSRSNSPREGVNEQERDICRVTQVPKVEHGNDSGGENPFRVSSFVKQGANKCFKEVRICTARRKWGTKQDWKKKGNGGRSLTIKEEPRVR